MFSENVIGYGEGISLQSINTQLNTELSFSIYEFKIRLIRLGFLSKNKNACISTHNLLILSQESLSLHQRANCEWKTQKHF